MRDGSSSSCGVGAICAAALFCCGGTSGQTTVDMGAARSLVRQAETQRVEIFERCARATVCIFADPAKGGGGSGVIFRADGYGLTNFHVVQEFAESRRGLGGLSDGQLYPLELIGIDPGGDIALFKLSGKETFDYAPLGDSDTLKVGESVAAMGNPFLVAEDLRPTITSGIISGLHRYQEGQGNLLEYADCIQVSTSINPGNSGGPLFNSRGEIIGINGRASFEERGRVNVGLGYAVTINQVRRFIPGLRAGRLMEHGTFGATVQTIGDDLVISAMQDFSPAERAGVRLGDKLLAVDGRPMRTANDFNNAIAILPAGWPAILRFEQGGKAVEARARLERVPLTGNVRYAFDLDRNQVEVQAIFDRARRAACPVEAAGAVRAEWRLAVRRDGGANDVAVGGEQRRASPALRVTGSRPGESAVDGADLRAASEFAAIVWPGWAAPSLDETWQLVGGDDFEGRVVAVVERRGEAKLATRWFFDAVSDEIVGAAFMDGDETTSRWRVDRPGCWIGAWRRIDAPSTLVQIDGVDFAAEEPVPAESQPSEAPDAASQPADDPRPAATQPAGDVRPASADVSARMRLRGIAVAGLTSIALETGDEQPLPQSASPQRPAATSPPAAFDAAIAMAQAGVVKIYAAGIGTVKGYASGVIVAADGRIVTVSSAILEDPSLRVVLADGRRFPATVVRRDETRRLAELKIDADGLTALELADTSRLAPGDWLLSASNTFKVAEGPEAVSVSLGVFAARGELAARRRAQDFPYTGDVIYTDMIVATPGSAGGALVDSTGRLVGVIGPLVKSTRTNTFANYALPAEEVAAFLAGAARGGETADGGGEQGIDLLALGVRLLDVGGRERPAFIERVRPGSAAYLAGLLPDDLLMSVGGETVASCEDVTAALARIKRGPRLEVVVKRGEELKRLEIVVGEAP